MPEESVQKPKSFLKEKIMRLRLVVFIKKNIIFFSFLLIFSLTLIFGIWNITRYEIVDIDGGDIESSVVLEIENYFEESIFSSNYFLFSPREYRQKIYSEIALIKRVRIEKVVPNKIVMFVQIHEPKYIVEISTNECFILSPEGFVLEEISKEGSVVDEEGNKEIIDDLCINYAVENSLIYFSSLDMEISTRDDGKRKLLLMEDKNRVVEVVEAFGYEVVNITLDSDVLRIIDSEDKIFTFSMSDDIFTQLKRYIIVIGKIRNDLLEFTSLDLRFERPVMRE